MVHAWGYLLVPPRAMKKSCFNVSDPLLPWVRRQKRKIQLEILSDPGVDIGTKIIYIYIYISVLSPRICNRSSVFVL